MIYQIVERELLYPEPITVRNQFQVRSVEPFDLFIVHTNRYIRKTDDDQILMFVDGACSHNGQPNARAGWAVCYGPDLFLKGRVGGAQTSNRGELQSVIAALQLGYWDKTAGFTVSSIVIASDSEYVVKGYCERLALWKQMNWRIANGSAVANRDLWEAVDDGVRELANVGVQVLFWHIPREYNLADKYAREATTELTEMDF